MRFGWKNWLVASSVGLGALASPAYALFEDDGARKAILAMRQQLAGIESRLSQLEQAGKGNLTLAEMLSEKDREIAQLRGQLEVATNKLAKLQEDYKAFYTDIDARLARIEPARIDVGGRTVTVPPEENQMYETALAHFKEANFPQASTQFTTFLASYPGSKLTPQVMYLLGSSQFAQGNYKAALVTQQDLAKSYPESPRAPDALLSAASSQLELRAINNAKKTLQELVEKYPTSAAADTARERLAILK